MVKRRVEKKVCQHLMRARGRKGFGCKRWSSEILTNGLGCLTTTGLFGGP